MAHPPGRLASLRLLVVTGKGGIGKTTVAAALGEALSRRGRRTLVLEVDPRENAHQMLGVHPSGGEIVVVRPGLMLQNLRPRMVLDDVVREQLRVGVFVRRVLASPVYHHFAEGCPGLKELAVLGHALRLVRGLGDAPHPDVDTVVLDAPATGHGVSLLAAPQLVADAVGQGPFGVLARELAVFLADTAATGVVAVTAAEEMPVQETLELLESLRQRLGRRPEVVVVNGLYPPLPPEGAGPSPLGRLWAERRAVGEEQEARLTAVWDGPTIELPLLPLPRGPRLVGELADVLAEVPGELFGGGAP